MPWSRGLLFQARAQTTMNEQFHRTIVQTVTSGVLCALFATPGVAQIRVACVGDSITWGQGASNSATTSYTAVLQTLLGSGYVVGNYGNPGKTMISNPNLGTVPYVTTAEYTNSTNWNPNIVVIQLGTNDALDGVWTPDGGEFAADAQALINHYAALAAHPKIYICLPPAIYGVGNVRAVHLENGVIPALRTVTGATLIDNYTPLRNVPEDFADEVHPSDAGHAILANDVYRAITNAAPVLPSYVAVGPDNQTRILKATDLSGSISLQTIATDGTTVVSTNNYGPFPGWRPTALCVGPDNCPHILWANINQTVNLWKLTAAGTNPVISATFAPITSFLPRDISVGADNLPHVLWDDTNNSVFLWRLSATDTNPVTSATYAAPSGYADRALAVGADNLPHILWGSYDGRATLWRTNSDGSGQTSSQNYGPFAGSVAMDMGIGSNNLPQVLWCHGTGFINLWSFASDGSSYVNYQTYAAPSAWHRAFLDVGGDNQARVLFNKDDGGTLLQKFGAPAQGIANGVYRITGRQSGRALEVKGQATGNGSPVDLWDYNGGTNQRWTVQVAGSYYSITGVQSGRTLDVQGQNTANGTAIDLWDWNGGTNQLWSIQPTDSGYYSIIGAQSGRALDVTGQLTGNGSAIDIWDFNGGANQQWSFSAP